MTYDIYLYISEKFTVQLTSMGLAHARPNNMDLSVSLVPRPSITANIVEGLVKLLHRMTSGGCLVDV